MWKIMFSVAIVSAMSILQGCDGLSMKPHKTSVTYGVADTEKDNGNYTWNPDSNFSNLGNVGTEFLLNISYSRVPFCLHFVT